MRDAAIKSIWNFRYETGNEIMVKTKHDFWSLLDHDVVMSHHTVLDIDLVYTMEGELVIQ